MGGGELLMLSTLLLWILQTSMPVLEESLSYFTLVRNSQQLAIPFNQALNQLVGLLNFLSAYCLLHQRAAGRRLSLATNLLFLAFGFCITAGHGMHTVCVLVEDKVLQLPPIHALVDFLHEVVSHNMFVGGMYCLMFLLVETERRTYLCKLEKKMDEDCSGDAKSSNRIVSDQRQLTGLTGVLLLWVWPAMLGTYFSIFATRTGTVPITILFYLAICGHASLTCFQLAHHYRGPVTTPFALLGKRELMVMGTMVKASCFGLPVLALWYANIIKNRFP